MLFDTCKIVYLFLSPPVHFAHNYEHLKIPLSACFTHVCARLGNTKPDAFPAPALPYGSADREEIVSLLHQHLINVFFPVNHVTYLRDCHFI